MSLFSLMLNPPSPHCGRFRGFSQLLRDFGFIHNTWAPATKPNGGYSGVAILSKVRPVSAKIGLDSPLLDKEGRTITVFFKRFLWLDRTPLAQTWMDSLKRSA
jgi:exonuclease III